jgi:hypothetical protein
MASGVFDAFGKEAIVTSSGLSSVDNFAREALSSTNSGLANFDSFAIENLSTDINIVKGTFDAFAFEVLVSTGALFDTLAIEVLVSDFAVSPIPVFPALPWDFPIVFTPNFKTIIGKGPSDREVRLNNQVYALWDIELTFPQLKDQTQNQTPYEPFDGFTQYQQLCQLWLSMYGKAGIFYFLAPWDNSRANQPIGTGDGATTTFTVYRTWGQPPASITEPVGGVQAVISVTVGGTPVSGYSFSRNKITFSTPPANGEAIVMTFSFYYLCKFMANEQDYEEFSKDRWTVKSLKFRSIIWP